MSHSHAILDLAERLRSTGRPYALVTVVRTEPATASRPGAKAVIEADGTLHGWIGGNCSRAAIVRTARAVLESGSAQLIRIGPKDSGAQLAGIVDFGSSCPSGGIMDVFIEPVLAPPSLVILGDSPIAAALSGLAARVGFRVRVSASGVDRERFPDAEAVSETFAVEAADLTRPLFAVVATQGQRDLAALEAALTLAPDYLGLIASRRKAAKLREKLRERGHDEATVAAIEAPAGLPIRAQTPEEIALSVLAGVVRARRAGSAGDLAAATG